MLSEASSGLQHLREKLNRIIEENKALKKALQADKAQISALSARLDSAEKENSLVRDKAYSITNEVENLRSELSRITEERNRLSFEAEQERDRRIDAERKVTELESRLDFTESDRVKLSEENVTLRSELEKISRDLIESKYLASSLADEKTSCHQHFVLPKKKQSFWERG